jgi:hypothetical protein
MLTHFWAYKVAVRLLEQEGVRGLGVVENVCVCEAVEGMCVLGKGLKVEVEVFFVLRLHYWGRGNGVCASFRLSLASKSLGEVRASAQILAPAF